MNIMEQDGETEGCSGADHVRAILKHGKPGMIDICIANSTVLSEDVLKPYREEGVGPMVLERESIEAMGSTVREYPLAPGVRYIRHDPDRLADVIMEVYRQSLK